MNIVSSPQTERARTLQAEAERWVDQVVALDQSEVDRDRHVGQVELPPDSTVDLNGKKARFRGRLEADLQGKDIQARIRVDDVDYSIRTTGARREYRIDRKDENGWSCNLTRLAFDVNTGDLLDYQERNGWTLSRACVVAATEPFTWLFTVAGGGFGLVAGMAVGAPLVGLGAGTLLTLYLCGRLVNHQSAQD
ncbi:MAG: hypothetical protein AB1758_08180 [Candidatus Eremiobacterota bacterium]